jgi:hypothetical protein
MAQGSTASLEAGQSELPLALKALCELLQVTSPGNTDQEPKRGSSVLVTHVCKSWLLERLSLGGLQFETSPGKELVTLHLNIAWWCEAHHSDGGKYKIKGSQSRQVWAKCETLSPK